MVLLLKILATVPALAWKVTALAYETMKKKTQLTHISLEINAPRNSVHRENNRATTDIVFLMAWRFILNSLPEITKDWMA